MIEPDLGPEEFTVSGRTGWITIGPYSVWLRRTNAGLIVEVYGLLVEHLDALAEVQVFDADIPERERVQ